MSQDEMIPYLHFTRGDYLLFEAWKPSSAGAVAGACIALVCLAILDRWLSAARTALDYYWRRKYVCVLAELLLYSKELRGLALAYDISPSVKSRLHEEPEKPLYVKSADVRSSNQPEPPLVAQRSEFSFARTIPPFILAHELPRGLFHAGQALLGYVLMLSIMCVLSPLRPPHTLISLLPGLLTLLISSQSSQAWA
ncbi:hypothetical protein DXG01_000026 [Tephrocybe rancida]|nr:hypothetical protein DXG01_000026 [Tephrocybe rancida]